MNIDRRGFSKLAGAAALAPFAALAAGVARAEETLAQARARSQAAHEALAKREGLRMMGAKVQLVAKGPELKPVMSDTGLAIQPDAGFAEVPEAPTILFVPGAVGGLIDALRDAETIAFLEDRGARAGYVTSVCTGSLLLAVGGEGGRQRAAEGLDVVAEADRVLQRHAGALGEVLQHGMGGVAEQGDPALDPADDGIAVAEHPEPPALAVLDDLPGAPPDMFTAMANVEVPTDMPATTDNALSLRRALRDDHRIEASITPFNGRLWVRLSAFLYNELSDYERLADAVLAITGGAPLAANA